MGVVTSILDAIRRFGSPTQRSALQRQDEFLQNKAVVERRRDGDRFVATVEPFAETVEVLSDAELAPILENASLVTRFMYQFGVTVAEGWAPEDLDRAFAEWRSAPEKHGYSDDAVVEIAGAAFGQLCVKTFAMRWVKVTDVDGTAVAIQGIEKDFRAFPYDSISKRIAEAEIGFFAPIFAGISKASEDDWQPP